MQSLDVKESETEKQLCRPISVLLVLSKVVVGCRMVLGKLPVLGHPTIWMKVGQGPIALAVGAGRGCLDSLALLYLFSSLSPSL